MADESDVLVDLFSKLGPSTLVIRNDSAEALEHTLGLIGIFTRSLPNKKLHFYDVSNNLHPKIYIFERGISLRGRPSFILCLILKRIL